MIIETKERYCWDCRAYTDHDVEYHITRRQRKIQDAQTCRICRKRSVNQHISRSEQQNGGGGDMRYRARRARAYHLG